MAIEIVPLAKSDIPGAVDCVQKAFADDPYFQWVFNDPAQVRSLLFPQWTPSTRLTLRLHSSISSETQHRWLPTSSMDSVATVPFLSPKWAMFWMTRRPRGMFSYYLGPSSESAGGTHHNLYQFLRPGQCGPKSACYLFDNSWIMFAFLVVADWTLIDIGFGNRFNMMHMRLFGKISGGITSVIWLALAPRPVAWALGSDWWKVSSKERTKKESPAIWKVPKVTLMWQYTRRWDSGSSRRLSAPIRVMFAK